MQLAPDLSAAGADDDLDAAVEQLVAHLDRTPPGPTGVVRFEVETAPGSAQSWTVRFATDKVALAPAAEPQAAVRARLADLVDLAAGRADVALLHLSEQLDVVGDEELVLALGTAIRTATGRPLLDAAALDPVAVSAAIGAARVEHLAGVMAGGFRELVLTEVFRRLPEFLIAEKAGGVRVAIGFEIERAAAHVDRYVVRIADGACTVQTSAPDDTPVDATIVLAGHEFLLLTLGHLNPVRGVLSGQVRVRGQLIKALGFNSVMRIPGS